MQAVTENPVPAAPGNLWWAVNALVMLLGQVVLFIGLGFFAFGKEYLPQVHPETSGLVIPATPLGWGGPTHIAAIALGMVLSAGLPLSRSQPLARGGATSQGIASVLGIGITLLGGVFRDAFYFVGPEDRCVVASCWPLHEQFWATHAPSLLACLVMFVMALLARRWPWWIRALTPPALWIVLLLVQRAVWDAWLLPIFQGPPR